MSGPAAENKLSEDVSEDEVAPPLFGSWRMAYVAVVAAFVLDVALFYTISRFFA